MQRVHKCTRGQKYEKRPRVKNFQTNKTMNEVKNQQAASVSTPLQCVSKEKIEALLKAFVDVVGEIRDNTSPEERRENVFYYECLSMEQRLMQELIPEPKDMYNDLNGGEEKA